MEYYEYYNREDDLYYFLVKIQRAQEIANISWALQQSFYLLISSILSSASWASFATSGFTLI